MSWVDKLRRNVYNGVPLVTVATWEALMDVVEAAESVPQCRDEKVEKALHRLKAEFEEGLRQGRKV